MKHLLATISFCITLLTSLCTHSLCHAAVKLPGFFGDHMVLSKRVKSHYGAGVTQAKTSVSHLEKQKQQPPETAAERGG